jgi:hypothetical protein
LATSSVRFLGGALVLPYALRFYLYLFVAGVVVVVAVMRWISQFGFLVTLGFGVVYAYLTIIIGRRVLGRKQL